MYYGCPWLPLFISTHLTPIGLFPGFSKYSSILAFSYTPCFANSSISYMIDAATNAHSNSFPDMSSHICSGSSKFVVIISHILHNYPKFSSTYFMFSLLHSMTASLYIPIYSLFVHHHGVFFLSFFSFFDSNFIFPVLLFHKLSILVR